MATITIDHGPVRSITHVDHDDDQGANTLAALAKYAVRHGYEAQIDWREAAA